MSAPANDPNGRPPRILAVETSGLCGSVAIVSNERCLAEESLSSRLTHSRRLLGAIERIMAECELGWPDLDAIAVGLGPGSFTGLRIGLATVKGLALATTLPLIGISSLDGLANQFRYVTLPLFPVFDARKGEVYTACFLPAADGGMTRRGDYLVVPPQELCSRITEPVLFAGDGVAAYGGLFRELLGERAVLAPEQLYFPRAAAIGFLALPRWHARDFLDPARCTPLYVRASEAEINLGLTRQAGSM